MPEDQLSIAIGKSGQNVRLASKLTGYELDIEADKRSRPLTTSRSTDSGVSRNHRTAQSTRSSRRRANSRTVLLEAIEEHGE